jgi:hypothetical protein
MPSIIKPSTFTPESKPTKGNAPVINRALVREKPKAEPSTKKKD